MGFFGRLFKGADGEQRDWRKHLARTEQAVSEVDMRLAKLRETEIRWDIAAVEGDEDAERQIEAAQAEVAGLERRRRQLETYRSHCLAQLEAEAAAARVVAEEARRQSCREQIEGIKESNAALVIAAQNLIAALRERHDRAAALAALSGSIEARRLLALTTLQEHMRGGFYGVWRHGRFQTVSAYNDPTKSPSLPEVAPWFDTEPGSMVNNKQSFVDLENAMLDGLSRALRLVDEQPSAEPESDAERAA